MDSPKPSPARSLDHQIPRRLFLRLDTLGARQARGLHLHPLGAWIVEPATRHPTTRTLKGPSHDVVITGADCHDSTWTRPGAPGKSNLRGHSETAVAIREERPDNTLATPQAYVVRWPHARHFQLHGYLLAIESVHVGGDVSQAVLDGEVTGVQSMHLRVRQVFQVGFAAFRAKKMSS